MKNPHEGHRSRVKERFLKNGLSDFQQHEAIELLLFFAIPQGDTNEIAHRLCDSFGSLSGVIDAPFDDLLKIKGVGNHAATLIKIIPEISRMYMTDRADFSGIINSSTEAGHYLLPRFYGAVNEIVIAAAVDAKGKVLGCEKLFEGSVNSAALSPRRIVSFVLKYNASGIILSHNHPSGIAYPSKDDIATTKRMAAALATIDVRIVDHIIVADDDFVSFSDSGFLEQWFRE